MSKTVIITGASRGIGRATAIEFGKLGYKVLIHYSNNRAAAEEAAVAVQTAGAYQVAIAGFDLRQAELAGELIDQCSAKLDLPDILVHNAGVWLPTPIADFPEQNLRDIIDLNLVSTFYLVKEFVKQTAGGNIVFVSSTAGQRGEAGYSGYAASKAGLIGMTKSLAVELGSAYRVNAVAPGWVDTDMSRVSIHGPDRQRILEEIPLKRVATAEDVANTIVFLAGDKSRQITGEVINVNGGSVLCG